MVFRKRTVRVPGERRLLHFLRQSGGGWFIVATDLWWFLALPPQRRLMSMCIRRRANGTWVRAKVYDEDAALALADTLAEPWYGDFLAENWGH